MKQFSRRSAFLLAAMVPAIAVSKPAALTGEAEVALLALGYRFDAVAAQLDHAIEHGLDTDWDTLHEFGRVHDEIVAARATTMEGLYVKARVACWARLGDLDAGEQYTAEDRVALSIIRDLIRLYHPHLERPGALRKLVEDIEQNARRS